MKQPHWNETRAALRTLAPPPPEQADEAFWREFRARALPQERDASEPQPAGWWSWVPLRYAGGFAVVAAIALWATFLLRGPLAPGAAGEPLNAVHSLHVAASHSAVMILQDESSASTIVWIAEPEPDSTP